MSYEQLCLLLEAAGTGPAQPASLKHRHGGGRLRRPRGSATRTASLPPPSPGWSCRCSRRQPARVGARPGWRCLPCCGHLHGRARRGGAADAGPGAQLPGAAGLLRAPAAGALTSRTSDAVSGAAHSVSAFTTWQQDWIDTVCGSGAGCLRRSPPASTAAMPAPRARRPRPRAHALRVPGAWHERLPHYAFNDVPRRWATSCRASTSSTASTHRPRFVPSRRPAGSAFAPILGLSEGAHHGRRRSLAQLHPGPAHGRHPLQLAGRRALRSRFSCPRSKPRWPCLAQVAAPGKAICVDARPAGRRLTRAGASSPRSPGGGTRLASFPTPFLSGPCSRHFET